MLASGRRRGTWTGSASLSQLLDHTSGVPHVWHYEYPDRPETMVTRARLIHDDAFLAVPPGRHFLYTNLGYGIVAELIERAEGAPFQRAMERVLFSPLQMRGFGRDAPHEILLRLWRVGNGLRGVLQEEIRDDRPGYARVSGVVLGPVR